MLTSINRNRLSKSLFSRLVSSSSKTITPAHIRLPPPPPHLYHHRQQLFSPTRRTMSTTTNNNMEEPNNSNSTPQETEKIFFGPYEVTTQVFHLTPHTFALVNLKPLLPGHVLICPRHPHTRLTSLSPPELLDLWKTVQLIQKMLALHYFPTPSAGSFNIAVQDGPEAGQTVPHVHVHVIPRIKGSTGKEEGSGEGDELYEKMAGEDGNIGGKLWDWERQKRPVAGKGGFERIEEKERRERGMREMEEEAGVYRGLLRGLLEGEEGN